MSYDDQQKEATFVTITAAIAALKGEKFCGFEQFTEPPVKHKDETEQSFLIRQSHYQGGRCVLQSLERMLRHWGCSEIALDKKIKNVIESNYNRKLRRELLDEITTILKISLLSIGEKK